MTDPLDSQQLAALDLGLMTRVVCHELNNLIANQRGYTRLLIQRGSGGDGQRWLGELAAAGDGLQQLVAGLQDWSRRPDEADSAAGAADWPAGEALRSHTRTLRAAGCALAELPLLRILAIVAADAGSPASSWSAPRRGRPPAEGVLLGSADRTAELLCTAITDVSGGRALAAWSAAAERILPPAGAAAGEWRRALALGLLRQSGGDLQASPERSQPGFALWLPLA